jgi:dipeptidyl aminopeptidase/acylaminoacyl peptidase
MQGDEDKVVPPEQSVQMYEAVKANGIPTTLMMYQVRQRVGGS